MPRKQVFTKEQLEKRRKQSKRWFRANKKRRAAYDRDPTRMARRLAYTKQYNKEHREERTEYNRRLLKKHPKRVRKYLQAQLEKRKKEYAEFKALVYDHYGRKCSCCAEAREEFLTIDHIGGGGTKHRKSLNGKWLYQWIVENKYPGTLRILCMNCNHATKNGKQCPHERERNEKASDSSRRHGLGLSKRVLGCGPHGLLAQEVQPW